MARRKDDGRGRLGGRAKGTRNKLTSSIKEWIEKMLDEERENYLEHLNKLESKEYVKAYNTLLGYIIPRQQAISIDAQVEAEMKQLQKLMETAPEEVITKIAEKMLEFQNKDL